MWCDVWGVSVFGLGGTSLMEAFRIVFLYHQLISIVNGYLKLFAQFVSTITQVSSMSLCRALVLRLALHLKF
jgi:hypothetical protein